ncbi:HAD family hydrolase [Selenomonas ruminantium]|uniref:haloacid dehalogenase-like hydrolase n=1 Tax=Selenomonas ruminantium TaxID=971 RepID=UPI0026EE8B6D|nr:HAD family hydrolase [Selenomonas ruminantium]
MKCKKMCTAVLAVTLSLGFMAEVPCTEAMSRSEIAQISVNKKGSNFQYWNKDAASYQALVSYVKDVTNPKSKNFIPVEDRIATYDMDGTFLCETAPYYFDGMLFIDRAVNDKNYKASPADREFALGLERFIRSKDAGDKLGSSAPHQAAVFEGMNYPEYTAYVRNFMETPVEGLSNLKWGEAFYLPMVETIQYLQNNGFQVYVVSGSERQLVRVLVCDALHIPENHIIGTDIEIKADHQGDKNGLDYAYKKGDSLVRGKFVIKNLQMNKVQAIAREIGKQPVLAFGNSSGDTSMLNYTVNNNKYKSAAFFLLCDDLVRELGDTKKAEKCRKLANENGWVPVSMRDDFKTIYGKDVTRNDKK